MAIHVRNNFCIAPFTQITFNPSGQASPCPEIGGRVWKKPGHSVVKLWQSDDFEKLRESFLNNEKDPTCNRCWQQEEHNFQSLRRRLFVMPHLKKGLINFIENDYFEGPRQMNLMTSNLCNLRCRICGAGSSVTYNTEGEYYATTYNIERSWYSTPQKTPLHYSDQQIDEMFQISKNLLRLEFYGGEPLLDRQTLKLLEKLVGSGQSKDITLFYSTNGITPPIKQQFDLWNEFKSIEFNFSFDDIDQRFTYNRHPAKWEDAIEVSNSLRTYAWKIQASFYAFCSVSAINVYYLPEALTEFYRLGLTCNLNNIWGPDYYLIENLPRLVRQRIHDRLDESTEFTRQLLPIKNMLLADNSNDQWKNFVFWTKAKDSYRGESFKEVMPEYYKILHEYDTNF